jgi:hypothetical protein
MGKSYKERPDKFRDNLKKKSKNKHKNFQPQQDEQSNDWKNNQNKQDWSD